MSGVPLYIGVPRRSPCQNVVRLPLRYFCVPVLLRWQLLLYRHLYTQGYQAASQPNSALYCTIRPTLIVFPVHRPGALFSTSFLSIARTKSIFEKREFAASRLAIIMATRWTGNKLFILRPNGYHCCTILCMVAWPEATCRILLTHNIAMTMSYATRIGALTLCIHMDQSAKHIASWPIRRAGN